MGIEPTLSAWEAEVLPLNYTRLSLCILAMRTVIDNAVSQVCWHNACTIPNRTDHYAQMDHGV